ncbi:Pathogenesis-related protein 1A [Bienertia sinuspersici]
MLHRRNPSEALAALPKNAMHKIYLKTMLTPTILLGHGPYGENIASGSGAFMTGLAAVQLWVNEKADYDYYSNTCASGKVCGHYTQVVWRDSARIGCARVQCNNGWYFVTCNYDSPGNWVGEQPY